MATKHRAQEYSQRAHSAQDDPTTKDCLAPNASGVEQIPALKSVAPQVRRSSTGKLSRSLSALLKMLVLGLRTLGSPWGVLNRGET